MKRMMIIIVAAGLLLGLFSGYSAADPGKILPYVSVKQEYSDNIMFSASNEEEDFITTCRAGTVLSYKTERVNTRLDGNIYRLLYLDNDQLDATDGSASGSLNYQTTEKLGFSSSASYRETSRRDADTDTTGLIISGDRSKADVSLGSTYSFTETSQGQAEVSYGIEEIDEVNQDEDNDTLRLNLSFSKNLSKTFKNTVGLLNFSYMNYSSELETGGTNIINRDYDSDIFQVYGGFSRDITELYNVYLQVGTSFTDTTEEYRINGTPLSDQDSSTWGGILLSGISYDGLYWDAGLSVSHDVRGGSGTNGATERSSVSLDVERKISEGFSLTLDASCYLNKNERKTQADLEELTFNVQPGFRFQFWDTFILSGVFRHTTVEDRKNDTSKERNLVYLVIRKNFDLN